jgi:hypothetical protein
VKNATNIDDVGRADARSLLRRVLSACTHDDALPVSTLSPLTGSPVALGFPRKSKRLLRARQACRPAARKVDALERRGMPDPVKSSCFVTAKPEVRTLFLLPGSQKSSAPPPPQEIPSIVTGLAHQLGPGGWPVLVMTMAG